MSVLSGSALHLPFMIICLFFVVTHEYGHIYAAKLYNWHVKKVVLHIFGGIAQMEFKHNNPKEELFISLAGPLVNFIFILLLVPLLIISLYVGYNTTSIILFMCIFSNVIIFIFNLMVPCILMDGGRVLRALLSLKIGHEQATYYAVRIGQFGGLFLAAIFIYFGSWVAAIIMAFMGAMAQEELSRSKLISALQRIKIKLANGLNKPELADAEFYELIEALESIQDEEVKERLKVNEITAMLKELPETEVSI
jgi:Zn-dependent protease